MRAGPRRTRIEFFRPTITGQNPSGEDIVSNELLGGAWASVIAMSGREAEEARQLFAEARFKIEIEHPLGGYTLQRKDTISWGTRTLDILDCEDPDQRRRSLVIMAKEFTL